MPVRAVLFDLDMTLVDSSAVAAYRRGGFWDRVWAEIDRVRPFTVSSGPQPHELPGLLQRKGIAVAVVTTSPERYAKSLLNTLKIKPDALVTYRDTKKHKPDPDPLQEALRRLEIDPEDAVHVGDDLIDVEAAYHAGVLSVGAGWSIDWSGIQAFAEHLPDVCLRLPSNLLKLDQLEKYRYVAEAISPKTEPVWHTGSTLLWNDERHSVQILGRYMQTEDPRHVDHPLSALIIKNKKDDSPSKPLARVLAYYLNRTNFSPDIVVPVPPKPDERNRFKKLLKDCEPHLTETVRFLPDGLRCLKDIPNYKKLSYTARREAIRGNYEAKGSFKGNVVLLDDVRTSGSTAAECAQVLRAAGAKQVRLVAFGQAQTPVQRKDCPGCGEPMRVRTNSRDGSRFWGCSTYPKCKRTIDLGR
jgi:HAD superfamily hydrolase (TIGR01549 family)